MRHVIVQTEGAKNKKGYQSVKLYIPNDTLMGYYIKTFSNTNKKKLKEILATKPHVLTNYLNELTTQ